MFESGAESGTEGWTAAGSPQSARRSARAVRNYYIASHRDYVSFDKYLQSGPYNFGWPNTKPDFVEHFPYQDGLLISYWDLSQADNNTGAHPGSRADPAGRRQPAPITAATAVSSGPVWPATTNRSRWSGRDSLRSTSTGC